MSFDRYESTDVGHYLHEIFAHGWTMIKIHLSLALHKNEGIEGVNSEEKSQTRRCKNKKMQVEAKDDIC